LVLIRKKWDLIYRTLQGRLQTSSRNVESVLLSRSESFHTEMEKKSFAWLIEQAGESAHAGIARVCIAPLALAFWVRAAYHFPNGNVWSFVGHLTEQENSQ